MIFDELVLHNFGVYGGRQAITLTPKSAEQPIVLFGGLNGGGKTTLLEALQLCLYGASAPNLIRGGSYEQYLRRCIHRRADAPEAALELAFRHTSNGQEHTYRLHRSWRVTREGACKESFEVLRDGALDRLATESWAEQVEEFIPARIASLFLFDGEKVEGYADLEGAPALISTAIQNLLGLDIVERLGSDLTLLERRKRAEGKPGQASQLASNEVRAKIEALEAECAKLKVEKSGTENALDRAKAKFADLDARYRREGGELYERRATLESEAAERAQEVASAGRELRELAGGAAPLLMIADLMAAAKRRVQFEQDVRRSREMAHAFEDEHAALLDLPQIKALPADQVAELAATLSARRATHAGLGEQPIVLGLSSEAQAALASLSTGEIPELDRNLKSAVRRAKRLQQASHEAQAALAAAPNEDHLTDLVAARSEAQAALVALEAEQRQRDAELERASRDLEQLREREARLAEAEARARFENEDAARIMEHSRRVRNTLGQFREAVVARHVARIERLVLESFHLLIRKPELVTGLRIDPRNFTLELSDADGQPLTPDRLSAGERQLLAVAILWGLAKASGRPLPTVIDTPLGRLDSHHRARLVERYFPNASHQVVLLSTDEEITGEYYDALAPAIGRTYRLSFDQVRSCTVVEEGYLEAKALRHVA